MGILAFSILFIFFVILFNKKVLSNETWRATITPLASIIGSGFLIAAPVLNSLSKDKAYLLMLFLCIFSFGIGTVIRWNIQFVEDKHTDYLTEKLSDISLAIAYILSVTYYLSLLSSFILKSIHFSNSWAPQLTSALIIFIAYYGHQEGFKSLEKIETLSVNLKLSIIFTFLIMLGVFNFQNEIPSANHTNFNLEDLRILLGLVIMVQGFETSRYLGESYKKEIRIKSMRYSQYMSTTIYMLFILLFTSVFTLHPIQGEVNETSVIDISKYVFQFGPLFLLIAAFASQLSAALADMGGCGGLVSEFTNGKISEKKSYFIIAAFSLVLIWSFNIFEVISLASKGFAAYYFLQCFSSARVQWNLSKLKFSFSVLIGLFCLCVVIFGVPFE